MSLPPKHQRHSQDNRLVLNLKYNQLVEKRILYKPTPFEDHLHIVLPMKVRQYHKSYTKLV